MVVLECNIFYDSDFIKLNCSVRYGFMSHQNIKDIWCVDDFLKCVQKTELMKCLQTFAEC